ncbi:MAG TPA: capsule assembly Wzi family protein [Terriglobales bacterium]|nr:capsule assembly Wzi family protein [Terriglobales bacterium]
MKSATGCLFSMALMIASLNCAYSQVGEPRDLPANQTIMSAASPHEYESVNLSATDLAASREYSTRFPFEHFGDFVRDQREIWSSPARLRFSDSTWLIPAAGISAALFATDRQYSASLPQNPATLGHYRTVSNFGTASLVGAAAGLYLFSYPAHNEHWRETGFLAGEAALNTLVTVEALKYSFRRERPYQDAGGGHFFSGGTSFPSEHAAVAWSVASVITHEYPATLPKLFAYGLASAVSYSRVRGREHFPSDVLVDSALGYMIAQSIFRRRHDVEIGGGPWETPHEFVSEPVMKTPAYMGSPYVPLDSWVYPAMERLAALGYLKTASMGIRPWTRSECARLLGEAAELSPNLDGSPEVQDLFNSLSREFAADSELMSGEQNMHAQIESLYQRSVGIAGTPLTDALHFGQTILNDYGRPYQRGFNTVDGASAWATAGPFVIYVRGEYQHSPSGPAPSQPILNFIGYVDGLPPNAPSIPVASISRFRPLDAYVGINLGNWQLSFGRQSLWWGAADSSSMLYSNNAEPLNKMFRFNRVSPFRFPWILRGLGDVRLDLFIGQLSRQEFINNNGLGGIPVGQYGVSLHPQPFLSGGKISFNLSPNLEFNFSKTTLYGGPGNPLTPKTFFMSTLDLHTSANEPLGDGRSVVDFSYRIPRLRNWLTLYGEGFSEDEVIPLNTAEKSAWQGGLYLARVPRLPRLDLRVEGGFTVPVDFSTCNGCFYHNFQYVNGYTNNGQLIASGIGRAAQGEGASANYWLSATKKIGITMRHRKIDQQFLPQGGSQTDMSMNSDLLTASGFRFTSTLQYERWFIPLVAAAPQSNITASFQFSFWPHVRAH